MEEIMMYEGKLAKIISWVIIDIHFLKPDILYCYPTLYNMYL